MSKVRCNQCSNEDNGYCVVKKTSVSLNKSRKCDDFVAKEVKEQKGSEKTPTIRMGYAEWQKIKMKAKEDRREVRRLIKEHPGNGTAKALGLIDGVGVNPGYEMSDGGIIVPTTTRDIKHPLTGDLSRFRTTVEED